MKTNDFSVVLAVAAITTAAAWMCLGPRRVATASDPQAGLAIRQAPSLQHAGVVLSLQTGNRAQAVPDRPTLRLTAINGSSAPRRIPVQIRMASTAPSSPLSRVVAMPVERWSQELLVELAPGQSRTVQIQPEASLPAGQEATITLQLSEHPAKFTQLRISADPAAEPTRLGLLAPATGTKG
jgi:hypothetical protein